MLKQYLYISALLLLPALLLNACNEDINVSTPNTYATPVITSFVNTTRSNDVFARPGDIWQINGEHLGLVDTVRINTSYVNVLMERISDEQLLIQITEGLSAGKIYAVSKNGKIGESSSNIFISGIRMPEVTEASIPDSGEMNSIIEVKGQNLQNISRPYFWAGNIRHFTTFGYQTDSAISVVVPVLSSLTAQFGFEWMSSAGADFVTTAKNITLSAPVVSIVNVPDSVVLTQRFELTGDNLNLIDGARIGTHPLNVYMDESSKYRLTLKIPQNVNVPVGNQTLTLSGKGGAAASVPVNVVALPTEAPRIPLLSYNSYNVDNQAFTKSVSATNADKHYLIYELPMTNKVVTETASGLQAPVPGEKFGHLYFKYNADSLRAKGARVSGGITFAHAACVTASTANRLRSIREPVLHFYISTNGATPTPTFEVYVTLSAGYYFSNGNRTAISASPYITTDFQTAQGEWKLVAIRLADYAWRRGSSTYGDLKLASEVQSAFYRGIVDEIRIRMRTTKSNSEDEIIEVNMGDFFISDRFRKDLETDEVTALDITDR